MKAFDCEACGLKAVSKDAIVRWVFEPAEKASKGFIITHTACRPGQYNRELPAEYVFGHIPEFIAYISRHRINKEELKKFIKTIEKGRSYIRRFNAEKKEVKKLIIRFEGLHE